MKALSETDGDETIGTGEDTAKGTKSHWISGVMSNRLADVHFKLYDGNFRGL